ncbi:unnamed protein product [Pylaiella littoralis]
MVLTIDLEAGLRPPPPERGTPDGRYVFEKKLGEGAEGQVYLAIPKNGGLRHQQLHQAAYASTSRGSRLPPPPSSTSPVAIKVVSGGRAYERCRATRGLWRNLVHPNVVFPRESWWDNANGRCFVRMELCEMDLLDLVCDEGPLEECRGSLIVGHLASALSHLHGQGIAHQDVKLENIFVSRDGVAKLGDLGSIVQIFVPNTIIEQQEDDGGGGSSSSSGSSSDRDSSGAESFATPSSSSSSSSFLGSVMYAPPEFSSSSSSSNIRALIQRQSSGGGDNDRSKSRRELFAADMWALGVSIWSAMAGCHPWELACVDRSREFQEFVRRGPTATLPRSFSPGLRSLLARLLSLDPRQRPTAAEVLTCPWVCPPPTKPQASSQLSDGPSPNAVSWPFREDFHVDQRQQQRQQQQPAPITPTGNIHHDDSVSSAADAADVADTTGTTTIAGAGDVGAGISSCPGQAGLFFSDASQTAVAVGGAMAGAAFGTPRVVATSPPRIRSTHRSNKKRKAPENGLGAAVATATPGVRKEKTALAALDHHTEIDDEFSPEMNSLVNILNGISSGGRVYGRCCCGGGGGGGGEDDGCHLCRCCCGRGDDGGAKGERPSKVARVSPSPLTDPAADHDEDVAWSFSGLGTQQSLLDFLRVPPPTMVQVLQQNRGASTTRPVPTSARDADITAAAAAAAAAVAGSIWGQKRVIGS